MKSNFLTHFRGIKNQKDTKAFHELDGVEDFFTSMDLDQINKMKDFFAMYVEKDTAPSKIDCETLAHSYGKYFDTLFSSLNQNLTNCVVDLKKIRLWSVNLIKLLEALNRTEQFEIYFPLILLGYKSIKKLLKMADKIHLTDAKTLNAFKNMLLIRAVDFSSFLSKFHEKQNNIQQAYFYTLECIEYLDQELLEDNYKSALKGKIYSELVRFQIELNNLYEAFFYLYKCKLTISTKEFFAKNISQINNFGYFPDFYLPVLDKFINALFSANKNEETTKLISDIEKLLPHKLTNYQLYFSFYHKIYHNLLIHKYFDVARIFLPKLLTSELSNIANYGQKCKNLLDKHNWKEIVAQLKNKTSTRYTLNVNQIDLSVTITLADNTILSKKFKKTISNNYSGVIQDTMIILPAHTLLKDIELLLQHIDAFTSIENIVAKQALIQNINMFTAISNQKPTEETDNINLRKNNTNRHAKTIAEPSKETRKNEPDNNRENYSKKKNFFYAQEIGFDAKFSNFEIYAMGRNTNFPDIHYGFYDPELKHGQTLPKPVEEKFKNVLRNGKIGFFSPCIKPVKGVKNCYKLAPHDDLRLFSQVVDRKNGLLLHRFSVLETHETQKDYYNKQIKL